eukprot:10101193-Alexandrium_andersonii.AAC.1
MHIASTVSSGFLCTWRPCRPWDTPMARQRGFRSPVVCPCLCPCLSLLVYACVSVLVYTGHCLHPCRPPPISMPMCPPALALVYGPVCAPVLAPV